LDVLLQSGELSFYRPLIFTSRAKPKYHGAVHEYLVCEGAKLRLPDDIKIVRVSQDVSEKATSKRWFRDLMLLKDALSKGEDSSRTMFYLAQTYEGLYDYKNAFEWYNFRVNNGGWEEETFIAMLRKARVAKMLNMNWESVHQLYIEAWEFRPTRVEPLYDIAHYYFEIELWNSCMLYANISRTIPMPKDTLFVERDIYLYKINALIGICAWYVNAFEFGKNATMEAMKYSNDSYIVNNLEFYK